MSKTKLQFSPADYENEMCALVAVIQATILDTVNTCEVVKVLSVDSGKKVLTVIPVVKNANVSEEAIEESPIYNVKYFGWQFGKCAIEAEPKEGDVGFVVISKRDISNINSGIVQSKRKFNMADGIYIGGVVGFNDEPTDFIKFDNNGITITTQKDLTVNAKKDVKINAEKNVEVKADTEVKVTSPIVNIGDGSGIVNLGGAGGLGVARIGDAVDVLNGVIVGGSTKVLST